MKTRSIRIALAASAFLVELAFAPSTHAGDEPTHRLGDHPAVVVQRLQKQAGYDYASRFYPHPAWLRLYAEQPRDEQEPVAVAASASGPNPALSIAGESGSPSSRIR